MRHRPTGAGERRATERDEDRSGTTGDSGSGAPEDGVPRTYECRDCLERLSTDEHRRHCPACGGDLVNLAVPRD